MIVGPLQLVLNRFMFKLITQPFLDRFWKFQSLNLHFDRFWKSFVKNIFVSDGSFWPFWPFFRFSRFQNRKRPIFRVPEGKPKLVWAFLESLAQDLSIGTLVFKIWVGHGYTMTPNVKIIWKTTLTQKFLNFQKSFFSISCVNISPQHIQISAKKVEKWLR